MAKEDGNWHCMKLNVKKSEIDDEIDEFVQDLQKSGIDPKKQGYPMGDNCQGYPVLKHIKQGMP